MLIIGGLAVVVLAALLGVVLLSMGEERAEKEQQAQEKAVALPVQPSQPVPQTPPAEAEQSAYSTGKLVPLQKEVTLSDVNNQLYEVTDALLMLAQRIGELDLRLNDLATTLEHRESPGVTEVTEITDNHVRVSDIQG